MTKKYKKRKQQIEKYGRVYWKMAQYRKNIYLGKKCVGYAVCDAGGRIIGQKRYNF